MKLKDMWLQTDHGTQSKSGATAKVINIKHICCSPITVFSPPCLSHARPYSRIVLLMSKAFEENLIGTGPKKTQTLRIWKTSYAVQHKKAFESGCWVRVWRGQGHHTTIGWAKYTSFRQVRLGDLDKQGCKREGRPFLSPELFLKKYLLRGEIPEKKARVSKSGRVYPATERISAVTLDSLAYEIRFIFSPCLKNVMTDSAPKVVETI